MSQELRGRFMTLREAVGLAFGNITDDTVISFTFEKEGPEIIPFHTFHFFHAGDENETGEEVTADKYLVIIDLIDEEEVWLELDSEVRVIEGEGAIIFSDNSILTINKNVPAF